MHPQSSNAEVRVFSDACPRRIDRARRVRGAFTVGPRMGGVPGATRASPLERAIHTGALLFSKGRCLSGLGEESRGGRYGSAGAGRASLTV